MASETVAKFGVEVRDGVSGSANAAMHALKRLRSAIDEDKSALARMQAAMRDLQGGSTVNIARFRELKAQIEAQKAKIADATAQYVKLGGTFKKLPKDSSPAKGALQSLLDTAKSAPGPLGRMAGSLGSMTSMLPTLAMAAGVVALGAAILALAAAAASAAAALTRYGLAQAFARREERSRLEGLTLLRTRTRQAAMSAEALQGTLDRVAGNSASSRGDLEGMTAQLYRMGYRGRALETALEGAAMSADVLGERGKNRFMTLAAAARRTGGSIDALAERTKARLGPAAARKMLDWDVQLAKLQESFAQLFSGLRIEGFLTAFRTLTQLFSQNTVTGRALKELLTRIMQPLIDGATAAMPIMRALFQRILISSLRLEGAILTLRNALYDAFGRDNVSFVGLVIFKGLVEVLFAPLRFLEEKIRQIGIVFAVLAAAVRIADQALGALNAKFETFSNNLNPDAWKTSGRALAEGLANGIRNGARRVLEAVRGLAGDAKRALQEALQIRSPSRVFAQLGLQIPRGVAMGVEAGEREVERSVRDVVHVPSTPSMDAVTAASPAGTAGGPLVHIESLVVHAASGEPADIATSVREALMRELEGLMLQIGGAR